MKPYEETDDDLAAALFYILGKPVPHRTSLEETARRIWEKSGNREEILHKIIALCGSAETPKQKYLVAKAYSWLGKDYDEEMIAAANDYLHTSGWSELSGKQVEQDGISVNQGTVQHSSILLDLARAQEGMGHLNAALFNFMEAYRMEPYRAMYVIKAADVVMKLHGKEEALTFLEEQKKSKYYEPVRYTDAQGNVRHNDLFKQLLDAQILKLREEDGGKNKKSLFHLDRNESSQEK